MINFFKKLLRKNLKNMNDDLKKFGIWMRDERARLNMTQRELVTLSNVGLSTIQGLEAGRAKSITPRIKEKIVKALEQNDVSKCASENNVTTQECHSSIDDFKPYLLRLAALTSRDDFGELIEQTSKKLGLPRLLVIVYLFENELKN